MARGPIAFSIDQRAFQAVARAMRQQADGKELRRDLIREMKSAVRPGVDEVRARARAMPHTSRRKTPHAPLGATLARKTTSTVNLTGKRTGVRVKIKRTPELGGFTYAARRVNRGHWRHPVFWRVPLVQRWVTQTSPLKGFFDDTLRRHRAEYKKGVVDALEKTARRVARRATTR